MKHILILSALAAVLLGNRLAAQTKANPGFLGRKLIIDVAGVIHPHITYNLVNDPGYNSKLLADKDWWDFGYKGGIGYNVAPRLLIGVQFSYLKQSSLGPELLYFEDLGYSISVIHEMLDYSSKSFALKVEFSGMDGIFPVGFTHGLSAGITSNTIINRAYKYRSQYDDQVFTNDLDLSKSVSKEFSLSYIANMRQPISQNIAINYGLAYQLNFMSNGFFSQGNSNDYNSIVQEVSKNRRLSIMTAHLGLSIIL